MSKLKIKTGDTVRIIAGDHKGYEGKIKKVLPKLNRAIVEGANMVSKHEKPSAKNPQGGIIKREASIPVSNLTLIDSNGNKTRVGYQVRDGEKVRFSKKSNEVI